MATKNMMLSAAAYPSFVAAYALLAWCVQYQYLPAPSVITVIVPGVLCALTFLPSQKTHQTQTHPVLHTVLTATPSFRRQQTCEEDADVITSIAASQLGLIAAEMASIASVQDNHNNDESLKMAPMMDQPVPTSALVVGAQC